MTGPRLPNTSPTADPSRLDLFSGRFYFAMALSGRRVVGGRGCHLSGKSAWTGVICISPALRTQRDSLWCPTDVLV
ncbi:hypothetical protein J6590_042065 [Homalodisca vitripennis]|nr:hypothetical protein J6590_042065 [Homalodisca vitripennis]